MVQKYQMTTEFIEVRRRALSVYLNKVVSACYYLHFIVEIQIQCQGGDCLVISERHCLQS